MHVLIVEDDHRLRRILKRLLEEERHVVEVAADGGEGLELAAGLNGIDVVILDLQLKKGTGFGVLRALRKILKRPAVVVFTNFSLPTYRETALELGAEHFLDKSRDYERLPEVLNEISARHH